MCSLISRKFLSKIEEKDLIKGAFNLEVSSPGIDKPISLPRQYKKNIGRKLEVETLDGEIFEGELKKIEEQTIALYLKERVEIIFLNKIKKAKVLISFN
jgi:ribosome maturation factor RimP